MDSIFEGLQKVLVGIVAAVTAVIPAIPATTPTQITPLPQPEIVNQQNYITRSGQHTVSGQTVTYIINIPQNGGEISGSLGGRCTGQISGNFDGKEGGIIKGEVNPSCGIGFLRYETEVTYSGNLYLKQGKADLDWKGNVPSTSGGGNVTVNFEPAI